MATVAATVMFTNLGGARLWDRDEPRNAGCAREMMERGNWVVPIFNDELRPQKPVLLYWLIMSAYQVFGVSEFAARFWSAALAVATSVICYFLVRRLFDSATGFLAGLILATSVMFVVAGRAATPDSVLIFCQTLALFLYANQVFGSNEKTSPKSWFPTSTAAVWGMYSVMAIGVLAKGLIGVVMPMAIIGMFMLIQRLTTSDVANESRGWLMSVLHRMVRPFHPLHFLRTLAAMRPGIAVAAVLLIAGPWYLSVGLATQGDFLRMFLLDEHFGRATTALENHSGAWWYYPVAIAIGAFPWSLFLVPTMLTVDRQLSRRGEDGNAIRFLTVWVCVQVSLFTLVSTKLPSYVTPCYPALAGLFAYGLAGYCRQANWASCRAYALTVPAFALVALLLTGGLAAVAHVALGGGYWIASLGLIWLIVAVIGWRLWRQPAKAIRWVASIAVASVLFAIGLFGFATATVDRLGSSEGLWRVARAADPQAKLATYRCLESSWVFYTRRPIWELSVEAETDVQTLARSQDWHRKPRLTPEDFLLASPDCLIVTTDEHLAELQARLGGDCEVVSTSPYFLRNKKLLLVAPRSRGTDRMAKESTTAGR